jgi:hypothetical protein
MNRDHWIPPFAEVNPGYDLNASALLLTYCIGDDRDPDELIDVKASGDFQIDSTLRDEIRAILLDSADSLSADDLDVQETRIPGQGPGVAYQIEVWLQNPWVIGLSTNVIAAGIITGWKKLWQKYHHTVPPPPASADRYAPSPEQELASYAETLVTFNYSVVQGELTTLNVEITDAPSNLVFRGTADFSDANGRTFHVSIDQNTYGWRLTHIIREHPKPE